MTLELTTKSAFRRRHLLAGALAALVLIAGAGVIAQDGDGSAQAEAARSGAQQDVLETDLARERAVGAIRAAGIDPSELLKANPVALYDRFGWSDASEPIGTNAVNANAQKILQVVEQGTANTFEVDFNRIRPGTIITNLPITISQPGYYYLIHDLTNTGSGQDGITIDADDVTLDLMGYALLGGKISGITSDDGIFVSGNQTNIKVRNGSVIGWDGDGINALQADFSIWVDLHVRSNEGEGLVTDFNGLIDRVTAFSNGFDGIEGDDGTVVYNSTAGFNGGAGIRMSEGCTIVASASYRNGSDGFDVASGSTVRNCTASGNTVFGFDMSLGTQITESAAYENGSNGFDMASGCILRDCVGSLNGGHGARVAFNAWVVDNKFHGNVVDGLLVTFSDSHIEGNHATGNGRVGIHVTGSGSFVIKNVAAGNLTNYSIVNNSAFGPIVDVKDVGDISTVTNADHPWVNLAF